MRWTTNGNVVTVDIHGMREFEAKKQLQLLLSRVSPDIREVVVVHGHHGGTVLRDMVRTKLTHTRIRNILFSLNDGQTRIELKGDF